MVRTAIGAWAVTSAANAAVTSFQQSAVEILDRVGARGTSYFLQLINSLGLESGNPRAVRHAVQEIVKWSMQNESAKAAECRCHLTYLLGDQRVIDELVQAARRDADLGETSALRRVVGSLRGTDEDALLEYVVEQLEYFHRAAQSSTDQTTLENLFRALGHHRPGVRGLFDQ